ncbi:bacterial Ig-like domain-containing protein [Companilactobacillus baiquanensis]|uniref:Bacterial Ig-like domain-containing protein n=1 Tax=Companilactobacillus baiquanensis TaxID=2486005 RepID=A0ABW1UX06_9LACO|nr:bacterial Ig-like domain-containing protein [Companilactobacillus baiquanensis]
MANIKLSKSQKVTIAGVTFFSAIILGGLNTTNVSAAIENSTADQAVEQTNTGTTSSGTDPKITSADTGSDNGVNTSGQTDSNIDTGSTVSGSDSGAGATGTDGNLEATNSGSNTGNNQLSSNNVSSYSATPVATAATEVPVADSQGNTIDWNNREYYDSSANSGLIINYKVQGTDGSETGDMHDQRGQVYIAGNSGDTVDLTKSLPQGYTFVDDSDKDQTIGNAYDGQDAQSYIDSITKVIYVIRSEGSTSQFIPSLFQFKYNDVNLPVNYFGYLNENVNSSQSIKAPTPVGFLKDQSTPPSGILISNLLFNGMHSSVSSVEIFKDNKTEMPNLVNFKLGDTTISSTTTDATKLGDSVEVTAPEGYTFADGSTTKSVTIGTASPMYMAYYATLGITDIDPSIHDLEVVKSPEIKSDETVNLNVDDSTWSPESAYDAVNSTDASGVAIPYAKLSVTIKKVGSDTPETSSTIDQTKPGKYVVTYSYNGVSSTTNVNVTQTPTISSAPSYDVLNDSAISWKKAVESAYLNGNDENGDSIAYNDLTVTIDGSPASEFEQTVGDHKVVYSYSYGDNQSATSETTLHIKQNPTIAVNGNYFKLGTSTDVFNFINTNEALDENGTTITKDNRNLSYVINGTAYSYKDTYKFSKLGSDNTFNVVYKYYLNSDEKSSKTGAQFIVYQDPMINITNDKDTVLVDDTAPVSKWFKSSTDEFGNDFNYDNDSLTVIVDGQAVDKVSNLDTSKVGKHTITYNYKYISGMDYSTSTMIYSNATKTVEVSVKDPDSMDLTAINIHNSTIHVGDSWNPEDNLDSATDADGKAVELDGLIMTNNVDTTKAGTYTATYSLNNVSEVATITVLPKSTTNPGTPSNDKEWLINAPYLVKADGYTQIYSSPSTTTPVATRQLAHDTDWMVGLAVQNSEGTFYQVSTSEWVKAEDMWAFQPIADVVYSIDPDNTEVFSTVDSSKTTDINLSYQTAWLVDRIAVDNDGNTWYRVGTSNYVKKSDVTKTAPDTTSNGIVQLTGTGNIPLYNLDYYGNIKRASRSVSSGTNWISNNHREFKGTTYHQISNSEWVSELDSVFKKQ